MPWPWVSSNSGARFRVDQLPRYPPTAPVPVSLSESNQTLSHYFADAKSNGRMVNLSVWIHPSAISKLARKVEEAPLFEYPLEAMIKAQRSSPPQTLSSGTFTAAEPPLPSAGSLPYSRNVPRRGRPSTAPTSAVSSSGISTIPAFGSRVSSLGTIKATSPLAKDLPNPSLTPQRSDRVRSEMQPNHAFAPPKGSESDMSDDLDSLPSLMSSQLSLCIGQYTHALRTPETEKVEWLGCKSPDEHGKLVKPLGIRSLGYLRA